MRSSKRPVSHPAVFTFLLALTLATPLFAQRVWEGSAIVGRYGEFPPGGLYAASNAFPLNSVIEVTNPETGETQRLIVAQRAENAGVLLVVSQAAAEELGVSRRATFRVQIEPVNMPSLTSVPPSEDLPFHPDPDINPRAAVGDPNAELLQPGEEEETEESPMEEPTAETPAEAPAVAPEPEEPPAEPGEPEAAPAPEITEAPAEEPTPEGEAAPAPERAPEPSEAAPEITEAPAEEPTAETPAEAPAVAPEPEEPPAEPEEPEAAPARDAEFYAALAVPPRPAEPAVTPELPVAPVEEALEVEASPELPDFPNPVELSVNLPVAPSVETPEEGALPPGRPGEELPAGERLSMAVPGDESVPDMREELAERPRPPEGAVTEIPLRIVGEPTPPAPEEEEIARPTRNPEEEIVSLEPAEFRPPEPPAPEEEEPLSPERPEVREETAEPEVTEAPEPPEVEMEIAEAPAEAAGEPETAPEAEAPGEPEADVDTTVAEEDPPVAAPPEPASEADERDALAVATSLTEAGYYLQVGAFSDAEGARSAVSRLGDDFPVQVVSGEGEMFRVFVGPLAEDERGAVLYLVRARGYRDAFLRKADG